MVVLSAAADAVDEDGLAVVSSVVLLVEAVEPMMASNACDDFLE